MAYRTSQAKTWPYLLILAVLFYLTLSVPRHWERSGHNRTLDEALAARPPVEVKPTPAPVIVRPEPTQEEVAVDLMPQAVVVAPTDPIADPFVLPSHLVDVDDPLLEDWLDPPADPPLPPANEDPHATPPPLDGWPRPHALLDWLERVASYPEYADWSQEVAAQIRELTTPYRPSADRTEELLNGIRSAVNPIQTFIGETDDHHLKSQLRRARYALRRRIDLWQLAQDSTRETYDRIASRAPLDDLALSREILAPRVDAAIEDVRAFTEQHTNGSTWDRYLRLDELDSLAAETHSETTQTRRRTAAHQVLVRLANVSYQKRYVSVAQNPAIGQLREALRHWSSETVDSRELLEHIEQYENYGLPSNARQIALHYQRLAFAPNQQEQQLGGRLARHYRNANVRMAISSELLNRMLPEPSTITEPIDDIIGGVPAWGTSNTQTQLRLRLVPDDRRLHMVLEARGTVNSASESDAGFATLYSEGTSEFVAQKTVVADRTQVHLMPAVADAESDSDLVNVFTRVDAIPIFGSLADSIVRAQADRRYADVISEVEHKVANKARHRLDEEVTARSANAQARLNAKVVSPLAQFGLDPTVVSLQTTDKRLILRHRLAGYEQLGAHTARPRAPSDSLISWQLHQSALNNALENLQLAGKTFDIAELHQWIHERIGVAPGKLDEDLPEDVVMMFPSRDVLRVTCENGQVVLTLVFRKFTRGRRSWTNFGVRARFEPQVEGRQIKLVRNGSFEIVSRKYGSKPQFLLRSIVARMLSETKEIDLVPTKIAGDPRIADLAVTQLDIVDGWIGFALGPQRNGRYVVGREPSPKR
ncbi:MAG: hypothetical protein MI757_13835 [Pirellulales bacterium]|nr:hypothetical protein [Pirellulales bacterium]